jgi:hypothetical protein
MIENNFEQVNNWEKRKLEIKKQIEFLESNCFSKDDFYQALEDVSKLDENDKNFMEIKNKFESSVLKCYSVIEFNYALNQLELSEEQVKELVAHENAHFNMAEKFNAQDQYFGIGFLKEKEEIRFYIFTYHKLLKEQNEYAKKMQEKINFLITNAPKQYGEELSKGDLLKIKTVTN